jgi:hypothetical protein
MLNKRLAVAQSVAQDLVAFETALDQALVMGANLTGKMISARMEANFSAVVGQSALDGIIATLNSMASARGQLVETHHSLKHVADDMGLPIHGMGHLTKGPPKASADDSKLKVVA